MRSAIAAAILLFASPALTQPRIVIVGDSTVAQYTPKEAPQAGWGMYLGCALGGASVVNLGRSGRSTRSYIDEGGLAEAAAQLQPGDLFVIEFGHNDRRPDALLHTDPRTDYRANLLRFIQVGRAKGAKPVLATSINRLEFVDRVAAASDLAPYVSAMKELGKSVGVPVIDLNEDTRVSLTEIGQEKASAFYMVLPAGMYSGYPDGKNDTTHLTEAGGRWVAGMAAADLKRARLWPAARSTCGA